MSKVTTVKMPLILTVVLCILFTIAAATVALANPNTTTCLLSSGVEGSRCPGRLTAKFDADITPKKLPKHNLAPAALKLHAQIGTTDATHPSALRELTLDLDRNVAIDAKGLPVCDRGRRDVRGIDLRKRKICRSSIIGRGSANFEIGFPERAPISAPSKLTVYNFGTRRGITTFYAAAQINVPLPQEINTRIEIHKIHQGRYGLRAVATVPVIAGGSGSLLALSFQLKRQFKYHNHRKSLVSAKCPDGRLKAKVLRALLKNEAETPGVPSQTTLKGTLIRPCRSRG